VACWVGTAGERETIKAREGTVNRLERAACARWSGRNPDLHAAKFGMGMPAGTIMGHEFTGEIAALGEGVDGWTVGERVVSLPYMSCGTMRHIGLGGIPGAYAELVRVQPDDPTRSGRSSVRVHRARC
jgi:Alcohol dehydrogenase GroES-like domain